MSAVPSGPLLNRYTEIGTLSLNFRRAVGRFLGPLTGILVVTTALLAYAGNPGTLAFAYLAAGTLAVLVVWSSSGLGLPLLPILAAQNLVIYGVPILASHENVMAYPAKQISSAGFEVLVFDLAMILSWAAGMRTFRERPPVSLVLHQMNREGVKGWRQVGFALVGCVAGVQVLSGFNFLDAVYAALPSGADSLINTLLAVVSACGFFLVAMVVGARAAPVGEVLAFWLLLLATVLLSADSFLLAGAAACLISVAVGLFWGSGRVPWTFLGVAIAGLAFFNLGKTTMRERYWNEDKSATVAVNIPLGKVAAIYAEWWQASLDALSENDAANRPTPNPLDAPTKKNQTLLDRIGNLENLLFIIDVMDTEHIQPLYGETYRLIPPLLVPRVFWPNKPRTHEGQVRLNTYFGRQPDLESTYTTYIAWGLLPEAYGNFGPILGSVYLGVFLGALFAWIEKYTARKLLISCEGFVCLSLLMNLLNSFEMVASVLVTSVFQSLIIVIAATLPFVRRMPNPVPEEPGA